jgi:hypothetical protein
MQRRNGARHRSIRSLDRLVIFPGSAKKGGIQLPLFYA